MVTVLVLLAFIVITLKPQWLPFNLSTLGRGSVVVKQADPNANLTFKQAPANLAGLSYHEAVSKAIPSVVRIYTTNSATAGVEKGSGSGVIIDPQGYVVTNQHVINGAAQIQVVLDDNRDASAKLVGVDPDNDLAVLKVDLPNLTPITMGREDELRVGDVVLAIGNPFDVGQSVSMGIVSALHRTQMGVNTFENFIQTDAAINEGNSGGALIDSNGNLVGINNFIVNSGTGTNTGNAGVGFAIPVSTLQQVAQELIKTGKVTRGYIGASSQNITPQMAKAFNLPNATGVIIASIATNGPAAQAGVQVGDILTQVNEVNITDVNTMVSAVAQLKPGESVKMTILRNGQTLELKTTAGERPTVTAVSVQ